MTDTPDRDSDEEMGEQEERFVCPRCTEEILVDKGVRGAILEHGCPVCSSPITEDAFE